MTEVPEEMWLIDLRWLDDPKPYLVSVPRIPCRGEIFVGPDDAPRLVVTNVSFVYESGYAFAPTSIVVETTRWGATGPTGMTGQPNTPTGVPE